MYRAVLSDALIYGGVDFLWKLINFALFPLFAYLLSVEEFGIYTLLGVETWLAVMVINCGLHVSLEKFYLASDATAPSKKAFVANSLSWLTLFGGAIVGGTLALSCCFQDSFQALHGKLFVIALGTAWPMALFHYLCNVCRVNFSPWKFAALHFLQNILALSLGLSLVYFYGMGVEGLLWGGLISFSLLLPLAYLWTVHPLPLSWDWPLAKTALAFGIPFLFNDLARWTYGWLDRFWLEQWGNLQEVGYFGIAFKIATPLIFLITAFSLAWTPYALKEERNRGQFLTQSFSLWTGFLTVCALGISLFGKEVLQLLTPPPFWEAAPLIPPIAMGLVFLGSTPIGQAVLMHTHKTKKIAYIAWLGGGFNCACNFLLIERYGALGASIALLATYAFVGMATLWSARAHVSSGRTLLLCGAVLVMGWCAIDLVWFWKGAILLLCGVGLPLYLCYCSNSYPVRYPWRNFFKGLMYRNIDQAIEAPHS